MKIYLINSGFCYINKNIIGYDKIPIFFVYFEYNNKKILYDAGCICDTTYDNINNSLLFYLYKKILNYECFNTNLFIDDEIDYVIISHYHYDHISRLYKYKNAKFISFNIPDKKNFTFFDVLPNNFENNLIIVKPTYTLYDLQCYNLFNDNKIILVNLPGHCNNQCGLILDNRLFFIADVVWTRKTYREFIYPSLITNLVQENNKMYKEIIYKINRINIETELDIIPSHCFEINSLLNNNYLDLTENNNINIDKNTRILITGGSGFLGSNLIKKIKEAYIIATCSRNQVDNIKYYKCDITDLKTLEDVFIDFTPNIIIHCAALCKIYDLYENFYKTNVIGTKNLIDLSLKYKIHKFIHISSPSIYFNNIIQDNFNIKENTIPKKWFQTHYNKTKLLAEYEVMKVLKTQMKTIILRPRGIYGLGDTTLLPKLIKNIKYIPKIDNKISLTHIDNVIEAIELSIKKPNKSGIYNITDDIDYNLNDIIDKICKTKKIKRYNYSFIKYIFIILACIFEIINYLLGYINVYIDFPFSLYTISTIFNSCTLNIDMIKNELDYKPKKNNIDNIINDM